MEKFIFELAKDEDIDAAMKKASEYSELITSLAAKGNKQYSTVSIAFILAKLAELAVKNYNLQKRIEELETK